MSPFRHNHSASSSDEDVGVITNGVELDSAHQNVGGAPIEDQSPMGNQIGWWSIIFLNTSMMIGTGIFSTPGTILKQTGSVGLALVYWAIGLLLSFAGFAYYVELAAIFPDRAGADVAYYEQIFKRPKFFFPATFAAISILLGFTSSNCIVFAEYVLYSRGIEDPDPWAIRGIAVASYALTCIIIALSTKWSLRISNILAVAKVIVLLFIVVTGFVVLAGGTKIQDPHSHFKNGFAGSSSNGNDLANALININFAYSGWNNANNMMNEIGGNRVKRIKTAGTISIILVFLLYFFANIAYFAAVPPSEAKTSGQLIAAVFFTKVFGEYAGTRILPVFIALSTFGNLVSVAIGQARIIREVARQGVIPFSAFWSSTKPFGTPAAPLLLKFVLTSIVIIAPPAGDAFNFLVSLQSYPNRIFDILLVVGVWILRRRRQRQGLPRPEYQAWNIALIFSILISLFILIMPWVPPKTGRYGGNVSFWYGTANVTGIGILVVCFIYWYLWAKACPRFFGYKIMEEIVQGENGELSKRFVRVYNDSRGEEWRRRRDASLQAQADDSCNVPRATSNSSVEKETTHVATKVV
ncbi:hypothetical protein FRC02_002183 [Tulasnella sp. 418]|nr:hypothetical protein FRC02_002183 [Tulasnella sp. 418]